MNIKDRGKDILKIGAIFTLIAGFVFIFSAVNVSAGGYNCYADSCLNHINDSTNISVGHPYLKVEKFVDKAFYTVGDEVGYTIVVRNLGNMTAHYVTVDDTLPEDISVMGEGSWEAIYNQNYNGYVSCHFEMNTNTNKTGKILKCIIPKLSQNGSDGSKVTIYFRAKVINHTQVGNHTNRVSVNGFTTEWQATGCAANPIPDECLTSGSCHPNQPGTSLDCSTWVYGETDISNGSEIANSGPGDQTSANVTAHADLSDNVTVWIFDMEKTTTTPYRTYGDTAEYEITFNTDGRTVNATIVDTLPNGFTYVNNSASLTGTGCTYDSLTNTTVGQTTTFTLTNVTSTQTSGCILKYNATISATQANGNYTNSATGTFSDNNYSITLTGTSASVHVERNPKLTVNKDVKEYKTYQPGDEVPFVIHVCNPGTTTAQNINLLDIVPYGYNFSNSTDNEGKEYRPSNTYSGGACSVTDVNAVNATAANVTVTCEGGSAHTHINVTVGQNQSGSDNSTYGNCNYNVSCSDNTTCSVTYNTCGLVKVEGDALYNDSTTGYKLTWHRDTLANGTCWDVDVNFTLLPEASGRTSINKVEVNASDGLLWKDVSPSVVSGQPSLSMTKSVQEGTVPPGEDIWYTIAIVNQGIAEAINLKVIDDPDVGIQDSAEIEGAQCVDRNGNTRDIQVNMTVPSDQNPDPGDPVTYSINGSIKPGERCTFKYKAKVDPHAAEKLYPNIATLQSTDTSGQPFPNITAEAYIQVLGAQASIKKTVVGGPLAERVGTCENITFNIKIENNGAFELRNIEINDTFPDGLEFINTTPYTENGNDSTHVWWVNPFNISAKEANQSVPPSKSANVTFKVGCNATAGINKNVAKFKAKLSDGTPVEGNSEKTFEVTSADLTITKRATPSQVNEGETATFEIEIRNNGMGAATNVRIYDNLSSPKFAYNNDVHVVAGDCVVNNTPSGNYTLGFLINNGHDFPGYQSCLISYTANVTNNGCPGSYTNTAELHYWIGGDCGCPERNKTANATVEVLSFLRFTISKSANDTNLEPGKAVNFTLTVSNVGDDDIVNGTVIDKLPDGFVFNGCGGGNDCSNDSANTSTWNVSVSPGDTTTLWVSANVTSNAPGGQAKNCANITSNLTNGSITCPISYNASTCNYVYVHKPNVTVVKMATENNVIPNSTVTYQLYVSNTGTATAYNVNVSDILPDSFNFSSNGSSVVCMNIGGVPVGGFPVTVYFSNSDQLFDLSPGPPCIIIYNIQVPDNATDDNYTNTVNVTYQDGAGSNYSTSDNETITVKRDVRLNIAKSANASYAQTNDTIRFTIVVTNDGANTAHCVNITDTVPDGFDSLSASAGASIGGNVVNWTCQNISPHGSNTYYINVTTNASAGGDLMNNASYYYIGGENDSANASVHILSPNLTISKWTDASEPVRPNSTITYNIIVANTGEADAMNVNVTDVLPEGLTYNDSLTVNQPLIISTGCTSVGNTTVGQETNFTIGNLPASTMCWFTYKVYVNDSAVNGDYTNNATVNGTKTDGTTQLSGDVDNETIEVIRDVELSVVKTANVTTASPGDNVNYTITVTNNGINTARCVNITDVLPTGFEFVSASPARNSGNSNTSNWTCQNISDKLVINIIAKINGSTAGTGGTNHVNVSGDQNVTDDAYVHVRSPELSISKWTDATNIRPNSTIVYNIIVTNTGDADAHNVNVTDDLPVGLTYNDSLFVIPASTGCTSVTNTTAGQTTTFTIGNLSPGTCWFTYHVHVNDSANGYYTNNATVNGTKADGSFTPGAEDNETINVIPDVELSVIKTANVTEVTPGDTLTYTITVTNDGDNAAVDAVINDTLPTGFTCDAVDATSGSGQCYDNTPDYATWTITIPPHSSVTITIDANVTSNATDPALNTVNVTSTYDNASTTLNIPVRTPILTIDKSANKMTADNNENIEYTLYIRNTGNGPATNITIKDLDDEYNGTTSNTSDCGNITVDVSVDPSLSSCPSSSVSVDYYYNNNNPSQGRIGFNVTINSTLQAGETCVITYTKTVENSTDSSACTAGEWMNNTANITDSRYLDGTSITEHPSDTWDVLVTATNLTFNKDVTPAFVQPGEQVTYTLNASNSGTSPATNVTINDTLPIGYRCQNISYYTSSGSPPQSSPGTISCILYCDDDLRVCNLTNLPDIPQNGGWVNVTIIANVTSNANDGANTNLAELFTSVGNKTATATNYVFKPYLTITKSVNDTETINAKPGDTINYTIIIKNTDSKGDAKNVKIQDNLPMQGPGGFNYSSNLFAVSCTNTTPITMEQDADKDNATFTINLIENNTECRFSYNVTIDERNVSDELYTNTANITQIHDNDSGNLNTTYGVGANDTANVNIVTVTNLTVVKNASTGQVQPGDQVTFVIDVTNYGASNPVYNVTLKDVMPQGFVFYSNTTNCSVTSSSTGGNTANYTILQVNASEHCYINITANVTTASTTAVSQLVTNAVSTTYNLPNETLESLPNATTTVLVVKPNLTIYKSNNATATLAPSAVVEYTLTIENIGGGDAVNVTIHDVLSEGLVHTNNSGISYTGCGGNELPANGNGSNIIDFSNISIENNSQCIIKYNVTVGEHTSDGSYTNTANISQAKDNDGGDSAGLGGSGNSTALVQQSSHLNVTKTVNLSVAEPGETVKFTINLTNSPANNPIYNVTTDDVLPEGYIPNCSSVSVEPISAGACSCDVSTRRVNCTFSQINATDSAQINITATLNATAVSADNIVTTNHSLPNGTIETGPNAQAHVEVVRANLEIYKNKNATIVYPGDTLRYEVIVMNTGQGKAKNITVRDVRQPGFKDADSYNLTCNGINLTGANLTTNPISDTITEFTINHTMNASETCHIYYDVNVTDNGSSCLSPGLYQNTANITSAQGNGGSQLSVSDGISDSATISIFLGEGSNIKVVKTASNASVQANDTINFTINITNIDGKNPVFNMTVTDTLPYGFNVQSVSASGNSSPCSNNGGTVSCNFSKINKSAGNGIYQINITAKVNGSAGSANPVSLNNVSYSYKMPGCEEETGHTDAAINVRRPELNIEKWTNNPMSARNSTVEYCLRVRNDGGADVNNVTVHDVLPDPFTYTGQTTTDPSGCLQSSPSGGSNGDFVFNCTLNASSSFKVCYNVSTDHASNGYYDNTVNITNATYLDGTVLSPSDGLNASSSSTVTINNIQRIIVRKNANLTVQIGDIIEYNITVINWGNVPWEDGTVTDTLASDVNYTNSTNTSEEGTYDSGGNTVTWTGQFISQGENGTYYINVTALSNTLSPVWNSVTAEGENISENADAKTYVLKPDLHLEKIALNETVLPGENVTYRITIINSGYGDAKNVTLTDVMPFNITHADNVNVVSCDGNDVNITDGDNTSTATFKLNGTLHGGKSCEFTYLGHVWERQADGLYTNEITMSANDTGNNSLPELKDRSTIQVKSRPGLFVVKNNAILSTGSTCAQGGDEVNFTIELHNIGDIPVYDIVVTDTLPNGLTASECTNATTINGGTVNCTRESDTKVTWTVSTIPASTTTTIWVTAGIGCDASSGTLTNNVDVLAHKQDGAEIRDDAYATVSICTPADIELYKTSTNGTADPGDNVTYTISVRNRGESRANISLTDALPSGWTYNSGVGPITDSCGNSWNVGGSSTTPTFATTNFNGSLFCSFDIIAQVPLGADQGSYANCISGEYSYNSCSSGSNIQLPAACHWIGVEAGMGIDVKKEINPQVVKHGDVVNYTILITNYGPDAVNVSVSDTLPKGLELISCPFINSSASDEPDASSPAVPPLNTNTNSSEYTITSTLNVTISDTKNETYFQEGNLVNWTATINNSPNSNATMTGVSFVYDFSSSNCFNVTDAGGCTRQNDQEVICNSSVIGNLSPGDTFTMNVTTNFTCSPGFYAHGDPTVFYFATDAVGSTSSAQCYKDGIELYNGTPNAKNTSQTCSATSYGNASLTKTANTSYVQPGDSINYTITINNSDTSVNMTNVVFRDALPPGFNCTSVDGDPGLCDNLTTGYNVGNITNNSAVTINITASVNASAVEGVNSSTNNANITYNVTMVSTTQGPYTLAVSQNTTVFKPNISVWKTNELMGTNNLAGYDQNVTYTLVVINDGGGDAINVTINDILNNPLYHSTGVLSISCTGNTTSVTVTNTSPGSSQMNFTFSEIENGTKCKITYKVTVPKYTNSSTYDNTATIVDGLFMSNESLTAAEGINNTASSSIIVAGTYLHTCAGIVNVPRVSTGTYHITARVTEDMTDQEFTNTVYADSNVPNGRYKSSTVTGYVENPKLTIAKWADETDVEPGAEVTFYVQIQNPTETNIIDLNVSDILPKGFEYKYNSSRLEGQPFNEFNVTPQTYNETSNDTQQNITWKINNISAKTTKLLTYKAYVRCKIDTGELGNVNSVCVNGTTHDNETVGACTNYTIIGHLANMSITKYANKKIVRWFDVVEYTVTIRNPAYESAHSILQQLNDTMAPKLKYINNTATIDGTLLNPIKIGDYSSGTTLIWNGSPFNETAVWMGSTVVLKYSVLVMPGANTVLDNNVTLDYLDPPTDGSGDVNRYAHFRVGVNSQIVRDTVNAATGNTQQPVQTITHSVTQSSTTIDRSEDALNQMDTPCVVPIKEGWNLISLPRHPIDTSIDNVLANVKDKYTDVFTYNGYTWSYKSEYMDKWFGEMNEMHEGVGYWIKATNACANGCEIKYACDKVTSANVILKEGWNLIGPIQTSSQQSMSVASINVPYTDIFGYDGGWKYKSKYMDKWFGDLSSINLGKGYWVKVEDNATMKQ